METEQSEADRKIQRKIEQLLQRRKRKEERMRNGSARSAGENTAPKPAEPVPVRELQKGDKVRMKDSGMIGEVIQTGSGRISISVGNIISQIPKEKAELISNREFAEAVKEQAKPASSHSLGIAQRKLDFKPNIDIRGQRLAEALETVSRFIDDALMVGMTEVKILHGKGNGILKEEIRKFLKTVPGVISCKDEDIRYGGSGITIVEMEA